MPLTEAEREITKTVVDRFLNLKESTPRRQLVIKFKTPEALERLVKCSILRTIDNERFLPMALAFHYCADPDALRLAKKSVEVVAHVLQDLFEVQPDKTDFTPADVEAHAQKMYDSIEAATIRLGLYLVQEFGVLASWGGNTQQTEITFLRIGERIVTLRDIDRIWDDHVRHYSAYLEQPLKQERRGAFLYGLYDLVGGREGTTVSPMQFLALGSQLGFSKDDVGQMLRYLSSEGFIKQKPASEAIALTHQGVLVVEKQIGTTSPDTANAESSAKTGILVLISHSGKDVDLASELTELLRAGIGLRAEQIRCSSVDGYRLPGGVNAEAQLRAEINAAKVLIGLITASSLSSAYVLFELGARWGAGLFMIPLLAGIKPEEMRGPLSLFNALSCSSEAQLHQLLADVAKPLGLSVQSPASYLRYITAVKQEAEAITAVTVPARNAGTAHPSLFGAPPSPQQATPVSHEAPKPPAIAASMSQWAGDLEMVVTRGPRLEIRFFSDTEPYRFLESPHGEIHYRMGIYNHGPGTAENLQVWLTSITPRPSSPLFHADFPYAVRWTHGDRKDNIGYRVNPRSELHFEFLRFWIASTGALMLDGIDTKQEPRDARFPIEENESWRMEYEISCANSDLRRIVFLVRREGQTLLVSRVDQAVLEM